MWKINALFDFCRVLTNTSTYAIAKLTWTHVVILMDKDSLQLFINGDEILALSSMNLPRPNVIKPGDIFRMNGGKMYDTD